MLEIESLSLSPDRFQEVLDPERYGDFRRALDEAGRTLKGRTVWNVNSTAEGGGVAELLHALLPYFVGVGIDARWLVIEADDDFFALTKRIHNSLHGLDEEPLGPEDREVYEKALAPNEEKMATLVSQGDIVVVHDPQPAGLVPALKRMGATVVWRCHIGADRPSAPVRMAWDFLLPAVREADAWIFSREAYAWEGLEPSRVSVIPPSIDAFSAKNQMLDGDGVEAILGAAGILEGGSSGRPAFERQDGSGAEVSRAARMIQEGPPPASAKLVTQVSRWDRLKDPLGVLVGFAENVRLDELDPHLVLAGPGKGSVADDPEEARVLGEVTEAWKDLPGEAKGRIHIACLPMEDGEENAAIVNALQRRSDVIVQKSLAEGFGLTVAEAMWKERPVVASRVGGIQDQVVHRETGLLIDDPHDLAGFGAAIGELLRDEDRARAMGRAGRRRVQERFLPPQQLLEHVRLFERLVS